MKMVLKKIILLSAVVLMVGSCGKPMKSLPGLHDISDYTYTVFDETILSGQQVDLAVNRYKEILPIIVVKDGQNYVYGDYLPQLMDTEETKSVPLTDKETVIDPDRTYTSFVMRDNNNQVVGIKLTERIQ